MGGCVGPGALALDIATRRARARRLGGIEATLMTSRVLIPAERVVRSILLVRGQKVILDEDLASLFGVETKTLNRAVKRNADRFPRDFCFRLTSEEWASLRYQFGTSKGRGGRRYSPIAFTDAPARFPHAATLTWPRTRTSRISPSRSCTRNHRLDGASPRMLNFPSCTSRWHATQSATRFVGASVPPRER